MVFTSFLAGTTAIALSMGAVALDPTSSIEETFSGADSFVLEGFVGTVEIRQGRTFAIEVIGAPKGGPLNVSRDGDVVIVTGDKDMVKDLYRRGAPYQRRMGWRNGDPLEQFAKYVEDYPALIVTMPEGGDLAMDTSALILDAEMDFGIVETNHLKEVYGSLGDAKVAELNIGGMGELMLGDVEGKLKIGIGGSGDVKAGGAAVAEIRIGGSGDVELGQVNGDFDVVIGGSGDVSAKKVGDLSLRIGGSGDVEVEDVDGGVDVSINGSGDFVAGDMNGELMLSINGSGDIKIAGGRSSETMIRINGSGDVGFGGVANDPTVQVSGSGSVVIEDYTGNVTVRGDKDDVRIGDLRFDDDR